MIFHREKNSHGSIAIVALWVLVLLAFLSIELSRGVQQKIRVAGHIRATQEARLAADSAVKKVISEIQNYPVATSGQPTGNEWYSTILGKTQTFSMGNAIVNFVIEDENSKLNINKAGSNLLLNLFLYASLHSDEAQGLADAVTDFRDADDYVIGDGSKGGSEKGSYRQSLLGYGPKNSDFEFVSEFQTVKGVTKDIYSFVEKYITIYTDGRININTCSEDMLQAMGLVSGLTNKIIAVREGRGSQNSGSSRFVFTDLAAIEKEIAEKFPLSSDEEESLRHAITQNEFCLVSNSFRIRGRARVPATNFSQRFDCVYNNQNGIEYWAEG